MDPQVIVITGGSKGIGKAMAREFLRQGHRVAICGRTAHTLDRTVQEFADHFEEANVIGVVCDVTRDAQLERLWAQTIARWGRVDIWINNAGVGAPPTPFADADLDRAAVVVGVNLLGAMRGTQLAYRKMHEQRHGKIYNMEGLGSDGRPMNNNSLYGSSKAGMTYFTRVLIQESKDSPVLVGVLSPGIVLTDLALDNGVRDAQGWQRWFLNAVADQPETVAPFLVDGILNNRKHGARIDYLPMWKLAWKLIKSLLPGDGSRY